MPSSNNRADIATAHPFLGQGFGTEIGSDLTVQQFHNPTLHKFSAEVALDAVDIPLLLVDREGRIRFRNRTAVHRLWDGEGIEQVLKDVRVPGEFKGWISAIRSAMDSMMPVRCVGSLRSHTGDRSSVMGVHFLPWPQSSEHDADFCLIRVDEDPFHDLTPVPMDASRRLASLGKLASRVAHELNNPLDGVLRYLNLAIRLIPEGAGPKLRDYLNESRTGLKRMVEIIADLLAFSRTSEAGLQDISVNAVVEEAIRVASVRAEAQNIVVAVDFQSSNMPRVRGTRLYQICCNLIKNAIDAMPEGGRLSVTTGLVGEDVVIRVSDTGVGLPDEVHRVFEPFFTTKAAGQGSGLGLSICKEYVEEMQGCISAEPAEGGGALFTVRIPAAPLAVAQR